MEVQNLIKTKGVRWPHAKQAEQRYIVPESNGFSYGHYPKYPGLTSGQSGPFLEVAYKQIHKFQ